ncbi:hypothetical protein K435DRAFT_869355 [Dendrothele bispora CBS 962.96]|uniref:Uncharacterized protein n=1 Tax=Dendrothele bispora (strain CBS 962.96) TaxID=1314807 RepID=A0A4V4HD04_DENBC|nr:hypothetical protein K435DRAFT_869355 [Dendrothele bispora CBS 962.96]
MSDSVKPLTQSESSILHSGGVFMVEYFPSLMTESLIWGFHIVAISFATYLLLQKRYFHSTPRAILLTAVFLMFSLSSTLFFLHIYQFAVQAKGIYLADSLPQQSLSDKTASVQVANNKASFAQDILFAVEPNLRIGCATVGNGWLCARSLIWRTWSIWAPDHRIVILPIFLWIASLGSLVAWTITRVTLSIEKNGWIDFNFRNDDPDFLLLTNYILSLCVNGLSTTFIGYKAWQFKKFKRFANSGSSLLTEHIAKILSLLVESGLVYFLIFSVQLVNFVPDPNISGIAAAVIAGIGNQLLGLYPTLIITLVYLKKTVWDSSETNLNSSSFTNIAFQRHHDSEVESNHEWESAGRGESERKSGMGDSPGRAVRS